MNLPLIVKKGEARIDSRLLAPVTGNQHKNVIGLIERYAEQFLVFGVVPFQTEKPTSKKGGRPQRFALLNEDQCYLLLTFARNTAAVVAMKVQLVQAFKEARRAAELHQEYLPEYHALHDRLHSLADGSVNERFVHMNINRLVNKVAGLEAGQRGSAPVPQRALMIAAQHIASNAMQGATDHKDGYDRAKAALAPLMPQKLLGS